MATKFLILKGIKMKTKLKYFLVTVLLIAFSYCFAISSSAEEVVEDDVEIVEKNIFSTVYEEITSHATEILCAMTFAGSLILAFAYKKGLMPLLKGSLISIGNSISKIKDDTTENAERNAKLGESIEVGLESAMATLGILTKKISELDLALNERLASEDDASREKEEFKLILTSQIDMLYDIFMTSALPQYQKDAVGERVAKMKGAISENACGN